MWFAHGVLEQATGLSTRALEGIAQLEREVVDADGGRLKLEWGRLRTRSGERVEDLLWWEEDRLVGFLGFYGLGSSLELAGMVGPDSRRRGIASALLNAATALYHERGYRQVLLIVPRTSVAGRQLALRRGGELEHSEHALVLSHAPTGAPDRHAVGLRPASPADVPAVSHLLEIGFGDLGIDVADRLHSPRERTLIVEVGGTLVGTLHVTRDGEDAGIYGFVIDPAWQGRGIGREVLRRVCHELRAEGARRVRLEVAVDNDRALRLYTSVGFAPVATEDYYALPLLGA
jgi:ribosomal protein S18 acetylase RimI-like enzyme